MKTKIIKAIAKGALIGSALVAIAVLSGCTLSVAPDGSRTYSTDKETFLKAIIVLSEK